MTILSVVRSVCATVGVLTPTSVFTNIAGNRTMQEMLDLANETAQGIAYDNRDWTFLKKTVALAGDSVWVPPVVDPPAAGYFTGGTTAFNLPADYKRMLLTSNVWRSSSTQTPLTFIPDMDEWMVRRADEWIAPQGEWTIYGGQIHIFPTLEGPIVPPYTPVTAAETAYFAYLHKNCVALSSGGYGNEFLNDADSFALDERLLKLGMIWKWKAQKGSPYAEDLSN